MQVTKMKIDNTDIKWDWYVEFEVGHGRIVRRKLLMLSILSSFPTLPRPVSISICDLRLV